MAINTIDTTAGTTTNATLNLRSAMTEAQQAQSEQESGEGVTMHMASAASELATTTTKQTEGSDSDQSRYVIATLNNSSVADKTQNQAGQKSGSLLDNLNAYAGMASGPYATGIDSKYIEATLAEKRAARLATQEQMEQTVEQSEETLENTRSDLTERAEAAADSKSTATSDAPAAASESSAAATSDTPAVAETKSSESGSGEKKATPSVDVKV